MKVPRFHLHSFNGKCEMKRHYLQDPHIRNGCSLVFCLPLGNAPEVNDRSSFVMIFDALSNAAYRVSLRSPGAEIEGGGFSTTPQQVVENLEAQQGAGYFLVQVQK